MTNFIHRDTNRRKLVSIFEIERLHYKSIIKDSSVSKEIKYKYVDLLNKLPRNSSKTRVRNRCVLTGRGRGVFRFCKLSRIALRTLASQGHLPGVKKSSW